MYTSEITKGVDIHILPTDKFETISFCILFRTPLKRETVTANSLLARAFLNGCEKYSSRRSIEVRLEEISSTVTANVLKKGEEHIIELLCKTTPSYIEEALELIGSVVLEPVFNNIDAVLNDLESTINSLVNDKRGYAVEKCIEIMCEKEAYGVNGDGYPEDIRNTDIKAHYEDVINNAKVDIIFVGDIKPGEVIDYVAEYIPLTPRDAVLEPCNYLYYPPCEKAVDENMDITQGKLCVGIRMNINPVGNDWYRAVVANELFGGSASSALFMEARESKSLCYYISSKLLRFKSIMLVEAGIDSENKDKVVDIIKSAFDNISEENIEIAKENIINGYKMAQDKPERIMDNILGGLISGKRQSIAEAIEGIRSVDTIKDIFKDSHLDTVFMLKREVL